MLAFDSVSTVARSVFDELQVRVARRILRLPDPVVTRLRGRPLVVDGVSLDSRQQLLLSLQERLGRKSLTELPLDEARMEYERVPRVLDDRIDIVAVNDFGIAGDDGEISVRLYRGADVDQLPVLVFFHGGGGVIGSLDSHDGLCRRLAHGAKCLVMAVDYRLAPEHPFPAGLNDARKALVWASDHIGRQGGDPGRVAIGGDSMGANFAAVLANDAAHGRLPQPCFSLLLYPMTDQSGTTRSRRLFDEGFFLTGDMIRWFDAHYRGAEPVSNPEISPLLAHDLEGVCPTFVATAGFDPLRDEGEAYLEHLRACGVTVQGRRYDGMLHGFVQMSGLAGPRAALADISSRLRRVFKVR